jgi:lipoprotein-anchoring transpeptidase ErfK/SrfK
MLRFHKKDMYNLETLQNGKFLMRPVFVFLFVFSVLIGAQPSKTVQAQNLSEAEEGDGAVLCAPDVYLTTPDDCLPLGPSETLTELARQGFPYPLQALPAIKRDDALGQVPFLYYQITEYTTNTYGSLDGAISKAGALRQIGPGSLIYVTYTGVEETDRGTYFQLPSGEWMPGDGQRVGIPNLFQGLEFVTTPRNAFGWVIFGTEVRSSPGYTFDIPVTRMLAKHALVQVYQSITVEGENWFLIGPDEWVSARQVAAVFPNTTPPNGVTEERWIDVDLAEQTLAIYENRKLVFAALVATGLDPFWTRLGLFQIYKMKETENMSGAFEADRSDYYYLENVPYTLYFDKARAIHGAYWRTSLGYPQSHGCVNMSVGDAAWLYRWAHEGDWVYVHDASGVTPSDPAFYGDGGA